MHPDRKIGFAMGILLIGIVGALFFRNEPLSMHDLPTVRREKQLNEQLRARDVAVYLTDDVPASGAALESDSPPWTLRELIQDLNSRNDGVPLPVGTKVTAGTSRPVHAADDSAGIDDWTAASEATPPAAATQKQTVRVAQRPGSGHRPLPPLMPGAAAQSPGDADSSHGQDGGECPADTDWSLSSGDLAAQVPEHFTEYTVKYGDTLSHIAERFLGSQSRFQEIYEANRDRISAPDKLQVGKSLRIPTPPTR